MKRCAILVMAVLCSACGGETAQEDAVARDTLTRAQRDSVIGASSLPGSRSVQRAINARDTANARASSMDSLLRN